MPQDTLAAEAEALRPLLQRTRRELHRRPEIGFDLPRTSALVAARLRGLGLDVRTGVGKSGVVGIARAAAVRGPAVLLRADMDALPLEEAMGREYRSEVPHAMHACGHDAHAAMLLGAAELIASRRDVLTRDVVLCFQPAEETLAGAAAMLADGVLDDPAVGIAYGMHVWPLLPAGTIHVRAGPTMAAAAGFRARIVGRGGHSSEPHRATDPLLAAALATVALSALVPRGVDPFDVAVLSVCTLQAGTALNVIPDEAILGGALRSVDPATGETLLRRVREVVTTIAGAAGGQVEFEVPMSCAALVNDPAAVEQVRRAAAEVVGPANVHEMSPITATEDFALFAARVPAAFAFLGAGNAAAGIVEPAHSPRFDLDESVLKVGAELYARLALGPA